MGWIVASLEGAIVLGGIGVLSGALASIGIPEDSIIQYAAQLKMNKYLVIVHGNCEEVQNEKRHLEAHSIVTTFDATPVASRA